MDEKVFCVECDRGELCGLSEVEEVGDKGEP